MKPRDLWINADCDVYVKTSDGLWVTAHLKHPTLALETEDNAMQFYDVVIRNPIISKFSLQGTIEGTVEIVQDIGPNEEEIKKLLDESP